MQLSGRHVRKTHDKDESWIISALACFRSLNGLNRMGYSSDSSAKTLAHRFGGMDAVVMARTGSGKTGAFLIPMLHRRISRARRHTGYRPLPTRELAVQTFRFAKDMAKFTDIRIVSGFCYRR